MADEYIVEMRHVTKRFPGIIANDDISLGIKKGEIFALLGENGAGKSTLMSMLFGMYEPDEGEIYVRGKLEHISSPNYATKLNIGMVHQHFKLVSNYTIAENIILGIEPKRRLGLLPVVDIKGTIEKVSALSKQYGLEVDPTAKIENINVSTQQRVEILKMLWREAEILIFDEPTAVLTPQEIEFLLQIIRGLRDSGKTIILITHKLEEIKQVADRCAILNRGKLIDVLDVATTSTQTMANLMVGREVDFVVDKAPPKVRCGGPAGGASDREEPRQLPGGEGCLFLGPCRRNFCYCRRFGQRSGGDRRRSGRHGRCGRGHHHPERPGHHPYECASAHRLGHVLHPGRPTECGPYFGLYSSGQSGT